MSSSSDMVFCPYNNKHKMLRKKLQSHIIKCRELHKNEMELLACPFNKSHLIQEAEFVSHVNSCIDRKIVANYKQNILTEDEIDKKPNIIETEENWDDDDESQGYDPQAYASTANVVRAAQGLFPSQRKQFIKQERKRLLGDHSDDEDDKKFRKVDADMNRCTSTASSRRNKSNK